MLADKLLINRKNISTEVKKKFNACKKFFTLEIEARVIASAMVILGLQSISDQPSESKLPPEILTGTDDQKKTFLDGLAFQVVDAFIMNDTTFRSIEEQQKYNDWLQECNPRTSDGRYKCRLPSCDKTFKYDGKIRKDHEILHGFHKPASLKDPKKSKDDMHNYQCSFLEYGMIQMNFQDAITEGDGGRVYRSWKFMLPYLRMDGPASRKYALEGLYLIVQESALLSQRDAHRLIWNRFHKAKSGMGGNIPLDMALEHYNLLIKTILRKLGSNVTNVKALDRRIKALTANKTLIDNFDGECGVIKRSGKHFARSVDKDLKKLVNQLISEKAMEFVPGRAYKVFTKCKKSLLEDFSIHEFYSWITEHKRRIAGQLSGR